jgi:hypothetical protein
MMLTPDALREFVDTELSDASLQVFIDHAFETITATIGQPGTTRQWLNTSGPLAMLSRRAGHIISITEDTVTLDEDDYELSATGLQLRRLSTGTNPASRWVDALVIFRPPDDTATRTAAAVKLIELWMNHAPGLTGATIGPWSEQYSQGDRTLEREREAILATLIESTTGTW